MASVVSHLDAQIYWAQVPEWVLLADISDRSVRLYGLLARRAGEKGTAFPSRTTLGKQMRCSVKSVDRALEELVACGAIIKSSQFRDGRQTVNRYTIMAMKWSPVTREGDTGDAPEGDTGDAQKESHRNESQNTLAAKPRGRDILFETLAEVAGHDIARLTSSERGRLNRACKELKSAGADPEQIRAAARTWRVTYPTATLTPTALAAHWSTLNKTVVNRRCHDCDRPLNQHDQELCDTIRRATWDR